MTWHRKSRTVFVNRQSEPPLEEARRLPPVRPAVLIKTRLPLSDLFLKGHKVARLKRTVADLVPPRRETEHALPVAQLHRHGQRWLACVILVQELSCF
jgi:hypothetical protein